MSYSLPSHPPEPQTVLEGSVPLLAPKCPWEGPAQALEERVLELGGPGACQQFPTSWVHRSKGDWSGVGG